MHSFSFSDQEARLFEMGGGFIAIHAGQVNLDDLLSQTPGKIVRCYTNPADCIKVFGGPNEPIGCVAGWVSDEEVSDG